MISSFVGWGIWNRMNFLHSRWIFFLMKGIRLNVESNSFRCQRLVLRPSKPLNYKRESFWNWPLNMTVTLNSTPIEWPKSDWPPIESNGQDTNQRMDILHHKWPLPNMERNLTSSQFLYDVNTCWSIWNYCDRVQFVVQRQFNVFRIMQFACWSLCVAIKQKYL